MGIVQKIKNYFLGDKKTKIPSNISGHGISIVMRKDDANLKKLEICFRNMGNPKNFSSLLETVDPTFFMHRAGKEMSIFKDIIQKSNSEHNREVNEHVLEYLHKVAIMTNSSDVLKECYNLAEFDMKSKKVANYDMNDPANQKAIDIIIGGLDNLKHNSVDSYSYGYQVISSFVEYSDSIINKVNSFVKNHPLVFSLYKLTEKGNKEDIDKKKIYMSILIDFKRKVANDKGVNDVKSLQKILKDANPKIIGIENSIILMENIVEASAKNPEANDVVLEYVKDIAAKTPSTKLLKGCYGIAFVDIKAKHNQGLDLENSENLKALDILKTGLLNKHNNSDSSSMGYGLLGNISLFSQKAVKDYIEFEAQHPYSQALNNVIQSKNTKGIISI